MIGFALDMDGTVYHGERPIEGVKEFIDDLIANNIPFRFITNNSSHSRSFYGDRLRRMGFNVRDEDVLTSTIATLRFLKEERAGKTVCPVATEDVMAEIVASGIPLVAWEQNPDIVLFTYDTTIDYAKINAIYHALANGSELVVTHPDDVCPSESGYDIDVGPFITMFESLSGRKATVVGKPNRLILDMAALEMGVPADKIVMAGDRLSTDIQMAVDAGCSSILVLSGETDRALLEASGLKPTFVYNSVADVDIFDIMDTLSTNHLN